MMSERTEEQKARSRVVAARYRALHPDRPKAATKRWRERNPDKVKEANKKPRARRPYDPVRRKAWYDNRMKDPKNREKQRQQCNARRTALRRWLDEYKTNKGCVDCGYSAHPHALHFDHVGPKSFNVSGAKSVYQAKLEILQCEVRCSICHSIKTDDRRKARMSDEILSP